MVIETGTVSGEEHRAMTDRELTEVLAAHADDLTRGQINREICLKRVPDRREELETLLRLAEQVKSSLVPVQPSPTFVRNLVRQLVLADDEESARPAHGYRREVVIGAAAVGSALSVIGVVAYLVRNWAQIKARVGSAG